MAIRYTLEAMHNRARYMTQHTKRTWEYEQGGAYSSHKLVCGSTTLRGRTKAELVDLSHAFMEGFFMHGDNVARDALSSESSASKGSA